MIVITVKIADVEGGLAPCFPGQLVDVAVDSDTTPGTALEVSVFDYVWPNVKAAVHQSMREMERDLRDVGEANFREAVGKN